MNSEVPLEYIILINLLRHAYVGKRHTPIDNAVKGIPSHELKEAKKALKHLIRIRWLNPKKTGPGLDVSINPRFLDEIKNIPEIKESFKDDF